MGKTQFFFLKYAETIKFLSRKSEKGIVTSGILLSSIDENAAMLDELVNVKKRAFRPSIPHLVYQYSFYTNYENEELDKINEEIGN
jgi:hypothetical protein